MNKTKKGKLKKIAVFCAAVMLALISVFATLATQKEEIRARAGERSGRDQSEEKRRSERSGTGVQGRAPVIEKRTAGTSGRQRARKRRRRGRKMLSRSNSGKKNAGQRKEKTQGESGLARSLRFFVVRVKRRKPLKFYIAVMYSVVVVCFASCFVFQA